jgi:CAP-Gly domain-containing linker protein 1
LKLGNLRKLSKSMESYWYEVIKSGQLDVVDLTSVARGRDKSHLMRLIENVMYLILHCPYKETYIGRIMSLRQSYQQSLMEFIERMLQKHDTSGEEGQSLTKKELTRLRQDKLILTQELEETQRLLVELSGRTDQLTKEKEEMKQLMKDLEGALSTKSAVSKVPSNALITVEYDQIVADKDEVIRALRSDVQDLKGRHEAEVQSLRDEVDVVQEKLVLMTKAGRDAEIYKKRLEELVVCKKQLKELQDVNETLQNKLSSYEEEIGAANSSKQMLSYFKEQVSQEKERVASLILSLEDKERLNKDLTKQKKELEELKAFQETKLKELREEFDSLRTNQDSARESDDSFTLQRNILSDYDEQIRRLEDENRLLRCQSSHDTISKHFNEQMDACIIARKMAEERLKDESAEKARVVKQLGLLTEEFEEYKEESNNAINDLVIEKDSLNDELESFREQLIDLERAKSKGDKLQSENERLKKEVLDHNSDLKQLYKDKDEVAQKYLKLKEELHQVQSTVAQKDVEIKTASREHQLLANELEALKLKGSGIDKIKQLELERDVMRLNSEISSLRLTLRDKEDEIASLKNASQSRASEAKSEEISSYSRIIAEKENEIQFLKTRNETMKSCWNKEMKLMTMVVHEVGMDFNRLSRNIQGPYSRS